MVEIGGKPILWHIMKLYAFHGISEFILCLGYKSHVIKEYFLNYKAMNRDFTVSLGGSERISLHGAEVMEDWRVTLADTGESTMTGSRILQAAQYLDKDDDTFMVTYGDGVSDVHIRDLLAQHRQLGSVATLTGVRPPTRFGELRFEGTRVTAFAEKPKNTRSLINGGFFCFQREFLSYLDDSPNCMLESGPLERCASDGKLNVFKHFGFWQCMDTFRDWQSLESQWQDGSAPWRVWDRQAETDADPRIMNRWRTAARLLERVS
jgi:glucose-1-phosphate cytidylyltransferase